MMITAEDIRFLGLILLGITLVGLVLVSLMLGLSAYKLRKLNIPANASFAETLHYTPILVVIAIDLLDLVLDVLAAPASWLILDRLGLKALRNVAAIEAIIPGTQLIPTLTLCWLGVRLFRIGTSVPTSTYTSQSSWVNGVLTANSKFGSKLNRISEQVNK
jgi:hypothetical protein